MEKFFNSYSLAVCVYICTVHTHDPSVGSCWLDWEKLSCHLEMLLTTCDSPQHYRKTINVSWLFYSTAFSMNRT